jgi:hypothetical protein
MSDDDEDGRRFASGRAAVEDEDPEADEATGVIPPDFNLWEAAGYSPSPLAHLFHDAASRFRFLIWGIKSGKTFAGAHEFLAMVVEKAVERAAGWKPGDRKILAWVVAPTYIQLETCMTELDAIFDQCARAGVNLVRVKKERERKYILVDGTIIHCRTAEVPDYLRGPNVDIVWVDESAFCRDAAWWQIRQRISARRGEVIATTTPNGRNWMWSECVRGGLPPNGAYGEFSDGKGMRWVSHHKTLDFPWVEAGDVQDARDSMPREDFDRDYEAKFMSTGKNVFRYIEEALCLVPLRQAEGARFVLGVDLAKQRDWTVIIVMDGLGYVHDMQRWTGIDWMVQKERLVELSNKWKASIVLDHANIGQTIADDLRAQGIQIHPVEMNSADVKVDLIQSLQMAFDSKHVKIPDPKAEWCPPEIKHLVDELRSYEASITTGGRISYGAPKGLHDDAVVALALAWWGKRRGLAGGGLTPAEVALARDEFLEKGEEFDRAHYRRMMRTGRRPGMFSRVFGRKNSVGMPAARSVWR